MKKIGLIVNSLEFGGAERCVADLSFLLAKHGHFVYIITDVSRGICYDVCGTVLDLPGRLSFEEKIYELKRIKKDYAIDISISFLQASNFINILSKQGDKVILTTHSVNSIYAKQYKDICWREDVMKELFQYADLISFPSEYCRRDWIEHFSDQNCITKTVYNPVHTMLNEGRSVSDRDNIIIAIGRMHEIKRQWSLLKAFKVVHDKVGDARLILLGDGALRTQLEELTIKLGISNCVEMPGNVSDVSKYLSKAKVTIFTSKCEAMSCSVLESISAGVPIVAFDIPGGIREQLGVELDKYDYPLIGKCGVLTEYEQNDEYFEEISNAEFKLAKQIEELLRNKSLLQELSDNCDSYIKKFLPEEIEKVWIEDILSDNSSMEIDVNKFEFLRNRIMNELFEESISRNKMYKQYYRVLERWMLLKEEGKSVSSFFYENDLEKVIIYGNGKMAKHLLKELEGSKIEVIDIIDKNTMDQGKKIEDVDCIVVTPTYDFQNITSRLSEKTTNKIINLEEIVFGINI